VTELFDRLPASKRRPILISVHLHARPMGQFARLRRRAFRVYHLSTLLSSGRSISVLRMVLRRLI